MDIDIALFFASRPPLRESHASELTRRRAMMAMMAMMLCSVHVHPRRAQAVDPDVIAMQLVSEDAAHAIAEELRWTPTWSCVELADTEDMTGGDIYGTALMTKPLHRLLGTASYALKVTAPPDDAAKGTHTRGGDAQGPRQGTQTGTAERAAAPIAAPPKTAIQALHQHARFPASFPNFVILTTHLDETSEATRLAQMKHLLSFPNVGVRPHLIVGCLKSLRVRDYSRDGWTAMDRSATFEGIEKPSDNVTRWLFDTMEYRDAAVEALSPATRKQLAARNIIFPRSKSSSSASSKSSSASSSAVQGSFFDASSNAWRRYDYALLHRDFPWIPASVEVTEVPGTQMRHHPFVVHLVPRHPPEVKEP